MAISLLSFPVFLSDSASAFCTLHIFRQTFAQEIRRSKTLALKDKG